MAGIPISPWLFLNAKYTISRMKYHNKQMTGADSDCVSTFCIIETAGRCWRLVLPCRIMVLRINLPYNCGRGYMLALSVDLLYNCVSDYILTLTINLPYNYVRGYILTLSVDLPYNFVRRYIMTLSLFVCCCFTP